MRPSPDITAIPLVAGKTTIRWSSIRRALMNGPGWMKPVVRAVPRRASRSSTRRDQHNLQLTVTVDDPKFYTKPWTWMRANFYWVLGQDFAETFCIPSEGIEYRDSLARPSGIVIP